MGHCCAGALFAIAQGRIENNNAVFWGNICHIWVSLLSTKLGVRYELPPLSGRTKYRHAQRQLSRFRPSSPFNRALRKLIFWPKTFMPQIYKLNLK